MSSYDSFLLLGVSDLKAYLAARGWTQSGTKQELVARCFVAWEMKTPLKSDASEEKTHLLETYTKLWESAGLPYDPLGDDLGWKDDLRMWPQTDLGKIFHFVIEKNLLGLEFIGQYKTHKAYSYWRSGFVDTIHSHKVEGKYQLSFQLFISTKCYYL